MYNFQRGKASEKIEDNPKERKKKGQENQCLGKDAHLKLYR